MSSISIELDRTVKGSDNLMQKDKTRNINTGGKFGFYKIYIKRLLDVFFSLILLVLLSPSLLVVAVLIKIDSKGPVFFLQQRPGKNTKLFRVYKFRTMIEEAIRYQLIGVEVQRNDSRITTIGRLLRRFKIDELPQLINILKGDMSFVGPRPTLREYLDQYEDWELRRFKVRPGLTGLAQVNGNIYLSQKEKSRYDIKYIEKISFITDLKIIIKTILIVIFGEHRFIIRDEVAVREENLNK